MNLYVNESEMLERYGENLKKAASIAGNFTKTKEVDRPKLFVEFINSLKIAAGSAHQLGVTRLEPLWLNLRDVLEKIVELGQQLPNLGDSVNRHWVGIQKNLEILAYRGRVLGESRMRPRQDVLQDVDRRMKNLPDTNNG